MTDPANPLDAGTDLEQSRHLVDHSRRLGALEEQFAQQVVRAPAPPAPAAPREQGVINWSRVASSVLGTLLIGVLGGAFMAYQSVHEHGARLTLIEQRLSEDAAQKRLDAGEQRATHDAIIRMTTTMEGLSAQVQSLSAEVRAIRAEPADADPPRRHHR